MIIEQTLHGYDKGHGMLASSFSVRPDEDSSLMAILSDWTGYRNESDDDSYMTFYPLSNGKKYAFAKTWYAEEMERPGCVWTHTLIVNLDEMDRNFDFRLLNNYFKRPNIGDYNYYQHKIEIESFDLKVSNPVFDEFDDISLIVLYLLLLGKNKGLYIYMEKNQKIYVDLCFYLLQYLPLDFLKDVELSTGSVSGRKYGEKDFSILFTNKDTHLSLSDAPWKRQIKMENFHIGLQYIIEQSKKENDSLPSLMRLFKGDILDSKDKLLAFASLMRMLDSALNGNVNSDQYAEILQLLYSNFPQEDEGVLLKYNFLSKKISSLYGTEEDFLYQIAKLENDNFLPQESCQFNNRLVALDKENHKSFLELMNKIAKLEHLNNSAVWSLIYCVNNMEESELLILIEDNWENILPILVTNEKFFKSGIWLRLSKEKFKSILLLYVEEVFDNFSHWDELLSKVIESEAIINKSLSKMIVSNSYNPVKIIFDTANNNEVTFISPFLLQECLSKISDILMWMNYQEALNDRVEHFILYNIAPDDLEISKLSSNYWNALLNRDNGEKNIEFYLYIYILAHNWKDDFSFKMLKQSFYHIYLELSKDKLSNRDWDRILGFTSDIFQIEKWDKCKILSFGLVEYLKKIDINFEELNNFTPYKKINLLLICIWGKIKL
ncbi:hypothetical protein [Phocaeicola massiliensis]|uniref:GAP1-N1 domain-containing protein n=3 Tax=Phocaeicola massiliensis TaxID=204516 RepID=UPI000E3F8899|nr:hypothetical protein [Phocaeicola massiliensis]RGF20887.1 hypothetical protein DW175_00265 [Bacteroides sp. AM16-15]